MLALLQRFIALSLALIGAAGAVAAIVLDRPVFAALTPVIVVLGYVAALGAEFCLLRASYARGDPLIPNNSDLMSAWIGETFAAPRAFLWRQPFRWKRFPDEIAGSLTKPRRGIVFVHGFFCNRGLWTPFLQRLHNERIPFVAVNLEPVFGSIDEYRDTIAAAVEKMGRATSLAPLVVAHSMGGLAVRAWLATSPDASRVHRVVTIASPHAGTRLARHSFAANIAAMRIDSAWLRDLWSRESASTRSKFICFWSHCDNIVFPTRSATLPEADNRHLRATAHVQMALHPAVLEAIFQLVDVAAESERSS